MRKVYLFMMISADGYFEGPNHDISWHNVDNEFVGFAIQQLDVTGTILFGRRTYEMMASFWPSEYARREDPETARRMGALPKVVFSHSLTEARWEHTELSRDVTTTVQALKQQSGKDIAVFGSSNLCITLLKENLLDELRLMINPILLGRGTALFAGLDLPRMLSLANTRVFDSGNVLLTYSVQKAG